MKTLGRESIHRLPRHPVHLYQHSREPGAYNNPMGCGAFTTAMALSCYDPGRFGRYGAARFIFHKMRKVPFFGGTFESQNARIGRKYRLYTRNYDLGTVADLTAAIDCGAPTIMLVNPGFLGIGRHDVLLVGYSLDADGRPLNLFVDNPALESATQSAPPGLSYPGNETYPVRTLGSRWTGCFTPFFASEADFQRWKELTGR